MPPERRLLVLASKPQGMSPSQRYRLEQWAPHLRADHRIALDLLPFESQALADVLYRPGHIATKAAYMVRDYARRAEVLPRARHYDAIVIHREAALIGPAVYERLLAWSGKPIIYDFDDAIWTVPTDRVNGWLSRLHFYGKTSTICRLSSAVSAGNEYLASYARERNPSVHVIPSSIELCDYPLGAECTEPGKFVVSWTGSPSTLIDFDQARAALEQLAARVPLVVKVICSRPPAGAIAGADTRFIPWSAKDEAADVADCHVGIMPLPDNKFSRGKGGMKALQFMATGRPVVVSPVGVNREIVEHGHNGFLASTRDEWVGALTRLAEDANLRRRLGGNARATVERGFTAALSAAKFAAVVEEVLSPAR